jgi:hypothetical protein
MQDCLSGGNATLRLWQTNFLAIACQKIRIVKSILAVPVGEADNPDETATIAADEVDGDELPELIPASHIIVEPDFLTCAQELREVFDKRFKDPRSTNRNRFLWDYWHVANQYTLIRTQVGGQRAQPTLGSYSMGIC